MHLLALAKQTAIVCVHIFAWNKESMFNVVMIVHLMWTKVSRKAFAINFNSFWPNIAGR